MDRRGEEPAARQRTADAHGRRGLPVTEDSDPSPHTLRFHATFKRGWLRGCLRNSEYLRPHARQVWDGTGRVTSTSASLHAYRGLKLAEGGSTPADDLTVAKPFRFDADPHGGRC